MSLSPIERMVDAACGVGEKPRRVKRLARQAPKRLPRKWLVLHGEAMARLLFVADHLGALGHPQQARLLRKRIAEIDDILGTFAKDIEQVSHA